MDRNLVDDNPEAFFPSSADVIIEDPAPASILPPRPEEIGPIFDDRSATAMAAWSLENFQANYPPIQPNSMRASVPERPIDFEDSYLYPTLARNERARLNMLWYYTRDLEQDSGLLRRLQDKVDLVKEFIGWEFVICGLLDNDVYTRLVTANLPLAILPRRESTCSHTILQPSGVSLCSTVIAFTI